MVANNLITNKLSVKHLIVIVLILISVLVSDWVLGALAIADVIMLITLIIVVSFNLEIVTTLNLKLYLIISSFLGIHGIYHMIMNGNFDLKLYFYSFLKIIFYTAFINVLYNFIRQNDLEHVVLYALNIGAIISIIIGLYITIAIISDKELPYEFLWTFTRTKHFSYVYKEYSHIIRTRSLFSEPAHLGYFLNTVLGVNLFSRRKKVPIMYSMIIVIGIGLTLSYASIGIAAILLSYKTFKLYRNRDNRSVNKWYILLIIPIGILIVVFYDYINITIIQRTIEIFDGTDRSAINRLLSSWSYITPYSFWVGNGVAHTPPIQNVYAYFLSDFGVIGLGAMLLATIYVFTKNKGLGLLFLLLNFQKGGYLSPIFPILLLLLLVYGNRKENTRNTEIDSTTRVTY